MTSVEQLLQIKGRDAWTTTPQSSVYDALRYMADKNVGALVVVDNTAVVGMFSERDYARKVALLGRRSRELTVEEIMTTDVVNVSPHDSIDACMELIVNRRVRHLPVIEGGTLLGLISIGDVVKNIIDDQRSRISHLENYITGRR